jgi:hypothetical protein
MPLLNDPNHYRSVLAYIDAGTGSLIIQVVIGVMVAGLAMLKIFWNRLRSFFIRNKTAKSNSSEKESKAVEK